MQDLEDYQLQPTPQLPREQTPRRIGWWVFGALLLLAAGAAVYVNLIVAKRPLPPAVAKTARAVTQEPPRSLGGEPQPVAVPPLDESDPLVRVLVRELSHHEVVAAWLATNGLIRNFTVVVTNIADGAAPAKRLNTLRPTRPFRVVESDGLFYVDPQSYDRSTRLADAIQSVDPAGAARVYATLKPRIEEAYGELGIRDRRFDQVLEQAIAALLRTPIPDGPVRVEPDDHGIGYHFADERLEGLSEAQKALLRMGPRNGRIVKAQLRDIAVALGIAPSALPR